MTAGQIKYAWAEMRELVERAADPPKESLRKCPACNRDVILSRGRHSQKFMWTHIELSDCQWDSARHSVRFVSEEEAKAAEVIFE